MTMTAMPATTVRELTPERAAYLDGLVARSLPYLDGAYGNEAAEYLISKGMTRDEVNALIAEKTLGA